MRSIFNAIIYVSFLLIASVLLVAAEKTLGVPDWARMVLSFCNGVVICQIAEKLFIKK